MPSLLRALLFIALSAGVVGLLIETRSLAELAGRHEVAERVARQQLGEERAARQLAAAEALRLQGELAGATAQVAAMADQVKTVAEAAAERAVTQREAELEALRPMPEGARQCLATLHTCLQAEGFSALRFLRASAVDDDGLHDVELLQTHADGLATEFLFAAKMQAELDRGAGRLVLRFLEGTRVVAGEPLELPAAGWEIVVAPVVGRIFEQQLPYLVRATGVYPHDEPQGRAALPTDVDRSTRSAWLDRLDRLLEGAGTTEDLRVEDFRGIDGGTFLEARFLATGDKGHVKYGGGCARLSVEVDRAAGVVSLLLQDGTLYRGAATSKITTAGMRILLPAVTPEQAVDTMLGLVVNK